MTMNATRKASNTFRADLLGLVDDLNDQAVSSLEQMREIQLAARSLLELEASRLGRKRGADAPQVQALRARAGNRVDMVHAIDVEAQIAAVRVPRVEKTDTLIQGRITDAASRGVTGVTVQLMDESGKAVAGVEDVRTDDNGYYAVVLKPAQAEVLADQKLKVAVTTGAGQVQPTDATLALQPGATLTQELKLSNDDLVRLKLRPEVVPVARPRRPTTGATRKTATRRSSAKKPSAKTKTEKK
jgi:hypothetical protein